MSWLASWFSHGLGRELARAVYGDPAPPPDPPILDQTEEEIRADEKRFAEDERRLDEADEARKRRRHVN